MSAIQEKYQSLIDMANQSGISGLNISEGDGFIKIEGTAPNAEVKQRLWDEYGRLDPEFRSGDLVMDIETADGSDVSSSSGGSTYTVQSGDTLSKIGSHFGISWHKIFEANRDKLDNPDKIYPGQELTIPGGGGS